ncbi:MAG: hypothetical protein AAB483_02575 [Patescibacteria group bacterium]
MPVITKKKEREVMHEDMASNIKTILEFVSVIPAIQDDIKDLKKGQEKLIDDVAAIKVGQKGFEERLTKVERKLEGHAPKTA